VSAYAKGEYLGGVEEVESCLEEEVRNEASVQKLRAEQYRKLNS
jgi:hypothetical protein